MINSLTALACLRARYSLAQEHGAPTPRYIGSYKPDDPCNTLCPRMSTLSRVWTFPRSLLSIDGAHASIQKITSPIVKPPVSMPVWSANPAAALGCNFNYDTLDIVNKSSRAPKARQHSIVGDQVPVYTLSGRLGLGYFSVSKRYLRLGCFPGTFAHLSLEIITFGPGLRIPHENKLPSRKLCQPGPSFPSV
jgi:hypothetical protein